MLRPNISHAPTGIVDNLPEKTFRLVQGEEEAQVCSIAFANLFPVMQEQVSIQKVDADGVDDDAYDRIDLERDVEGTLAPLCVVNDQKACVFHSEIVVAVEGRKYERCHRLCRGSENEVDNMTIAGRQARTGRTR